MIKNFKILKEHIAPVILSGAIAATVMTGCGSKKTSKTSDSDSLANITVVTFSDGTKELAIKEKNNHYKNIVTNEIFAANGECNHEDIIKYDIENIEGIAFYLTNDEKIGLRNGSITKDVAIDLVFEKIHNNVSSQETTSIDEEFVDNRQSVETTLVETTTITTTTETMETTTNTTPIIKNDNVYYEGLSKYFGQWNIFSKEELSEDVNKKIDDLLIEIKNQNFDLSEIDCDIVRQYFLAPYVLYNGKKDYSLLDSNFKDISYDAEDKIPVKIEFKLYDNNQASFHISKYQTNNMNYYYFDESYKLKNALFSSSIFVNEDGTYTNPCIEMTSINRDESLLEKSSFIARVGSELKIIHRNDSVYAQTSETTESLDEQIKQLFCFVLSNINELNNITFTNFLDMHQDELIGVLGDEYLETIQEQKQKTLIK